MTPTAVIDIAIVALLPGYAYRAVCRCGNVGPKCDGDPEARDAALAEGWTVTPEWDGTTYVDVTLCPECQGVRQ